MVRLPPHLRPAYLALAVLSLAGAPAAALAQPTVLSSSVAVRLHSVIEVSTLSPPAPEGGRVHIPRPRHRRDPEWLDREKARLADGPGLAGESRMRATAPLAGPTGGPFEGLANSDNIALTGFTVIPPDANLGVGPAHVFQMVNILGRITDKSGGSASTFALADFFAIDMGADETDPRVIFDAQSNRWFATYAQSDVTSSIVLAVSTSSDPTGAFCLYRLGNPTTETFIQDFPQIGVSADKVVVAYNGFSFVGFQPFVGAGYYVVNKADLLTCSMAPHVFRSAPDPARFSPHPVQTLDGTSTLYVPIHSLPQQLTVLAIDGVPGVSPVTETPTILPIRSWTVPPNAAQPGSPVLLDTGDDSILTGAFEGASLWLAGNESCVPAGDTQTRSCLRIIEVRTDSMTVRQDTTFGSSGQYYYYPALRPDDVGNLHVVFNASSSSTFAGLWTSGRLVGDPLGALQAPTLLRAGGGAQTSGSGRMGDYSGAARDPVDPHTVWVNGEYIRSTASRNWGTYVAPLAFGSSPTVTLTLTKLVGTGTQFHPGDTLQVDLTVSNPGPALGADVFLVALLPPAAGPAFGCPGGDAAAFFTSVLPTAVLTCLSAPPQSFPALVQNAVVPGSLPLTAVTDFLSFVWPATAPAGTYTFVFALTTPGAFADGIVGPDEFIATSTAIATFSP
jgi:hypothetical protein